MFESFRNIRSVVSEYEDIDLLTVWKSASFSDKGVFGAKTIGKPSDFAALVNPDMFSQENYCNGELFRQASKYAKNIEEYEKCLKTIKDSGAAEYGLPIMWEAACIYYCWFFYEASEDESLLKAGVGYFLKHRDEFPQFMEDILIEERPKTKKSLTLKMGHYKLLPGGKTFHTSYSDILVYPVRIMQDTDTNTESVLIRYIPEPTELETRRKIDIEIQMSLIARHNIVRYADQGLPIDATNHKDLAKLLHEIIQRNRGDNLPIIYKIGHIGWVDQPDDGFIPFKSRAQFSNASRYSCEYRAIRSPKGNLADWIELFKPYRDGDHLNLRIIMAASFSSVLVRKLGGNPFLVDIWSSYSGIGKTVALMAAASVWANPDSAAGYLKTCNSTQSALMEAALFCCDLPLCLDEQQTVQDTRSFDQLIYKLCEGVPRGRAASNGGLRDQYGWKNCIFVTGEEPIVNEDSRAGVLNRVIQLYCSQPLFSDSTAEIGLFCDGIKHNYGKAGRQFVRELLKPENLNHARELFEGYRQELVGAASGKQALSGALILTADTLADEWIFKDGVRLSAEQMASYLAKDEDTSTNDRALEYIYDWISAHISGFDAPDYKYGKLIRYRATGQEYWAIRKQYFDEIMNQHSCSSGGFIKWALNKEIMIVDTGRKDRSVNFNGNKAHCICIAHNASEDKTDLMNSDLDEM